ncbi:MAG TPA: hypothetical protein VFX64_03770 [Candidatus Nitrosotalea sp.]|nr:hypothetical protein [Candidatus Nitrosotalea sp.]
MKILLGVIIGVTVLSFLLSENTAHGIWVPKSPQELWNGSDTIFVGNVTSANTLQLEKKFSYIIEENGTGKIFVQNYTIPLDKYQVNVEEFLKNPQNSSVITVMQPTISAGPGRLGGFDKFNVGDHVLFYVEHMDGNNTYSPESFVIPEYCAGKDVLTQERFEMGNEFFALQNGNRIDSNFTANVPLQFVWNRDVGTLDGKNYDVLVYITKSIGTGAQIVFNKEIHVESKPCQWVASAKWEFTPQEGEYGMDIRIRENGTISHLSDSGFSVKSNMVTRDNVSPLQQFKSGISASDVKCKPDFLLVVKSEDNHPACTTPLTALHLLEFGWGSIASPFETKVDLLDSKISGGQITGFHYDLHVKSIVIQIQTTNDGHLTVTIPRKLLDIKESNGQDSHFYVLMDA